jgi:hypothetical protein
MRRSDIPTQRLAAALLLRLGPVGELGRMMAVGYAHRMRESLDAIRPVDGDVLARALHSSMCAGTSWGEAHDWHHHQETGRELVEYLRDPELIDRLIDWSLEQDRTDWSWWRESN